jgi:2-oxoacid:acceptor oxidoreductase delta subunit (pyruvate/2-ketoisovalerate family)
LEKEYIVPVGEGIYSINTGDWRTHRPVMDKDKCIKCGLCFLYCPVFSIIKKGEEYEIDLSYCKGCGICAHECPKDAIQMIPEGGKK